MGPEAVGEMRAKYDALLDLAQRADDDDRPPCIRRVARRWPGALREAELAGPDICANRRRALEGQDVARLSRGELRRAQLAALPLWAILHAMLGDQLRARARHRSGLTVEQFVEGLEPGAGERWAPADRLISTCGERVRARQAYLWLAHRAGLTLPELNWILFERQGHWDLRDGDPDWAQMG